MQKHLIILLSILLVACGSINSSMNVDSRIKDIELDMTKEQVVGIMGRHYNVVEATKNSRGDKFESISYDSYDGSVYMLLFKNGKLTSWYKNKPIAPPQNHRPNSKTTSATDNSGLKRHLEAHRKAMLSGAESDAQKEHIKAHMDAHEKAMLGN